MIDSLIISPLFVWMTLSPVLGIEVPNAVEWNKKTYLVTCNGRCRNIESTIHFSGGDARLFANEGGHPITIWIQFSWGWFTCPACSMCQYRQYGYTYGKTTETCKGSDMNTENGNRCVNVYTCMQMCTMSILNASFKGFILWWLLMTNMVVDTLSLLGM